VLIALILLINGVISNTPI